MKKRTLKVGRFQRHYATNGILMYRERKNLIELPEGTMVTILKARRQTHLASVRCVNDAEGHLILGSGKKAVDICLAIPAEFLPKMKIEGVETKSETKGKSKGKGKTATVELLPVVAAEEQPAGIAAADIQQPAVEAQPAEQPAVEQAPVAEQAAPAEQPAPQVAEQAPVEAAV